MRAYVCVYLCVYILQCRAFRCLDKASTARQWTCLQKPSTVTPRTTGELRCEFWPQLFTNPVFSWLLHLVFLCLLHIPFGLSKFFHLCDSLLSLRFYGNRSYCYWCLEQYHSALTDAHRSIQLAPDWPKGYFRKGCALMGLKVSICCTTEWQSNHWSYWKTPQMWSQNISNTPWWT